MLASVGTTAEGPSLGLPAVIPNAYYETPNVYYVTPNAYYVNPNAYYVNL